MTHNISVVLAATIVAWRADHPAESRPGPRNRAFTR
jgi:hypothetical protein